VKLCASNVSEIWSALTSEGNKSATALDNIKPTILVTDKDPKLGTFELVTSYLLLTLRMGQLGQLRVLGQRKIPKNHHPLT